MDRFEGKLAVLLLEANGETVVEVVVEEERLPEDGRHADTVLQVELEDDELVGISCESKETAEGRGGTKLAQ